MSQLIKILHSPFWAAGILTVILLTAGDYKWWMFGLYVLFAFLANFIVKTMKAVFKIL